MNKNTLFLGYGSAIICLISMIIWIVSFIGIALSFPIFLWSNIQEYILYVKTNNQLLQYLVKFFMIVFSLSYMILIHVFNEIVEEKNKILSKVGGVFSILFAIGTSVHYFVQLTAVRFAINEDNIVGLQHIVQANPSSVLSSINMLSWTIMLGFSALFTFWSLENKKGVKWIKRGLLVTSISCFLAGLGYLLQIDILTFLCINIGMGGGILMVTISIIKNNKNLFR